MDRELISQAEYARRRGVKPPSVCAAVKSGRISLIHGKIDPTLADMEWDRNTDHAKREAAIGHQRLQQAEIGEISAKEYMIWKARRERADALSAELDHQKKAGNLYLKAESDRAAKTMARLLRDTLLGMPFRISAKLATMDDAVDIERFLTAELRKSLASIERDALKDDHA